MTRKKRLQPRNGLVVVRMHEKTEATTDGGIVIPRKAGEKDLAVATVEAVGPGRLLDSGHHAEIDLHRGDIVMVQSKAARPLSLIHDRDLSLINEQDILARITEGE